MLSFERRRA
jgi:hypothetical protein